jgi:hypothetical protein
VTHLSEESFASIQDIVSICTCFQLRSWPFTERRGRQREVSQGVEEMRGVEEGEKTGEVSRVQSEGSLWFSLTNDIDDQL